MNSLDSSNFNQTLSGATLRISMSWTTVATYFISSSRHCLQLQRPQNQANLPPREHNLRLLVSASFFFLIESQWGDKMLTFFFLLISTTLFFKIIQVEVVNDHSLIFHLPSILPPASQLWMGS